MPNTIFWSFFFEISVWKNLIKVNNCANTFDLLPVNFQGEDLICQSKEFIHCGEVYSYSPIKHRMKLRSAFLFDNQLILCKKVSFTTVRFGFIYLQCIDSNKMTRLKNNFLLFRFLLVKRNIFAFCCAKKN